jgi:cytochrome P450
LARIEGSTALRTLFETFPNLSLAQNPQWCTVTNLRGRPTLPATIHTKDTNGFVSSRT